MKKIEKILPHLSIILAGMIMVFFVIDRVNGAMGFMSAGGTKILIFILCALSILVSILLIKLQRAEARRKAWRRNREEGHSA